MFKQWINQVYAYVQQKLWFVIAAIVGICCLLLYFIVFNTHTSDDQKSIDDTQLELQQTAQTNEHIQEDTHQTSKKDQAKKEIVVDIKGAVQKPSTYKMAEGDRVQDVLKRAGISDDADLTYVNLSEKLMDQKLIIIPKKGQQIIAQTPSQHQTPDTPNSLQGAQPPVNINTATVEQLTTVKGIGKRKAELIIAHREEKGAFTKIEDLKAIKGFGDKTLARLREYLTV